MSSVEHDPLRNGDDTLLSFVKSRQFCFYGVICISHLILPFWWTLMMMMRMITRYRRKLTVEYFKVLSKHD